MLQLPKRGVVSFSFIFFDPAQKEVVQSTLTPGTYQTRIELPIWDAPAPFVKPTRKLLEVYIFGGKLSYFACSFQPEFHPTFSHQSSPPSPSSLQLLAGQQLSKQHLPPEGDPDHQGWLLGKIRPLPL